MKWFDNLGIANKLRMAFAVVMALTCVLGGMAFMQISRVNQSTHELASIWMPAVQTSQEMKAAMARFRVQELQKINNTQDNADTTRYEKMMADILAGFEQTKRQYEALLTEPEEKALYAEYSALLDKYMAENSRMNALLAEGRAAEARALMRAESSKITATMNKAMDKIVAYNIAGGKKAQEVAQATYHQARMLIGALLGACIVLGSMLAYVIGRAIARPLEKAVQVARTVAQGDLTSSIEARTRDEAGQLLHALRDMNGSLTSIVSQVRAGTETIATAAGEISSGNFDLSARTEEQASSLEQTAASMEELTTTVKQNADNARQANQLAVSASEVAAQGGQLVSEVVGTMASISQSAGKIADIISVIDGIAFQTNILALNAAVEAARAGAEGRGFAVVASEVRALAQRSASAAREIKELITDSLGKVESGTRLVDRTGATMQEILTRVQNVTDIMGEISAASQEQASGIDQINQSIAQMDQAVQQNAALVEESAAASESMREQAARLSAAVSIFRLDAGASAQLATPLSPASHAVALASATAARPDGLAREPRHQHSRLQRSSQQQLQRAPALAEEWTEF